MNASVFDHLGSLTLRTLHPIVLLLATSLLPDALSIPSLPLHDYPNFTPGSPSSPISHALESPSKVSKYLYSPDISDIALVGITIVGIVSFCKTSVEVIGVGVIELGVVCSKGRLGVLGLAVSVLVDLTGNTRAMVARSKEAIEQEENHAALREACRQTARLSATHRAVTAGV
jgi:hypothetical protein